MSLLQQAIWLDRRTVALPRHILHPDEHYQLTFSPHSAGVPLDDNLTLPENLSLDTTYNMLKGELALVASDSRYRTGLQIGGVLDDVFHFDGKLGPQFPGNLYENISIAVWAPTARNVKLLLFRNANDSHPADTVPMQEANGVWSAEIENSWRRQYYLFSVTVYVPKLGQIVENLVTDPYSADLALNGSKSRLTDLTDPQTKPEGWDTHTLPELRSFNELTIWELHVRDFSANDQSVPAEQRGTYLAFTRSDSNGMQHLRRLADAGIKAVHLLPTFHIASVDEDKSKWKAPGDLSRYPPDSPEQQAVIAAIKDQDAFNWGYDPVHFMAPAGCYAVNPDTRVKEYRSMVQALHTAGLHVIQDQVFNHTSSNGQSINSVLDKIVPGYYYRLDEDGNVRNATCCSDTASERKMMEKLMVDCLVQNSEQYKVDGHRFDLMGYHFVQNMQKIQAALGPKVYLYGEGWGTAETEGRPGMPNATQTNLYGTRIGTFNDRMRDAIRGGNPFSDPRERGFATGDPANGHNRNLVRASLAGNLRDLKFLDYNLDHNGADASYTALTAECINYCSCHDNQTLFDAIQIKAPIEEDSATRARRQVLALSFIALGQGIPFFHAGDELLRSKDMDHNSYNSGDWFNRLDFTYQNNNWGIGLPIASENESSWPIMQPLLSNPALKPTPAEILYTRDAFEALLRVRSSSGLFRLQTLTEVRTNLELLPCDDGVIVMKLTANTGTYDGYQKLLIIFNANTYPINYASEPVALHPALNACGTYDATTSQVSVPGLTTGVFI